MQELIFSNEKADSYRLSIQRNIGIMSKDVDRNQVLQNIRVRHTLKRDGSWIHKSKDVKNVHEVESQPALSKQKSYVLLTARRFGCADKLSSLLGEPDTTSA
ncbi:unnamed protein product [Menidia menidia]|uniref:(Atlantic silverside) hypothetical protein n=1 Tax=Menidia menidia TaxID=238744 RepID=A0A8S4AP13_9TELE|nr:unnamed protein product [Menidia menidia]